MQLDWPQIDRWLMGEAWTGAQIQAHLETLCEQIGPRWSSTEGERRAAHYIRDQLRASGLENAALETFQLDTWAWVRGQALVDDRLIDMLPFNYCPSFSLQAPLVDVGYGTPHQIEQAGERLAGAVAVMALVYEPFTAPLHLAKRLQLLAEAGAAAAMVVERKDGRRMEYHSACDWRTEGDYRHPLPTVVTSREDGALLRKLARTGQEILLEVESRFFHAPTANVAAELPGSRWPDEHLLLGGHHDTVYGTPGGNDNASGTAVVLEVARVLAKLQAEQGIKPGRSIRFVTFSAEEQNFQGAFAYVARHHGPEPSPRLAINLDELATGPIKGVVLAFPQLRPLVQQALNDMGDGLQCHVMAQLDATSDHYPFLKAGLEAAHLWRWRFSNRHADSDFHHESGDTVDKVNVRELKEYIGQLARLLLRLSHLPPQDWPENPITPQQIQQRLVAERETVIRVF